jgi:hypothetical protein
VGGGYRIAQLLWSGNSYADELYWLLIVIRGTPTCQSATDIVYLRAPALSAVMRELAKRKHRGGSVLAVMYLAVNDERRPKQLIRVVQPALRVGDLTQ